MSDPKEKKEDQDVDTEDPYDLKMQFPPGYKQNPPHLDGAADMASLVYLEEDNVLYNLNIRYKRQGIYTYVASIMIAINPYEELAIYGTDEMKKYRGAKRHVLRNLPPHCYAIAEESYQLLARTGINQSMVICGESGSGKTESAKVFMRFLADASEKKSDLSIEDQFLQANPILEAFGNAQTNMNNNSSRFGKFTKVLFEPIQPDPKVRELPRPKITGSFIETYLLEKSRVVHQDLGERNYHVFYQLFCGLDAKTKQEWLLDDMKAFHYINQSNNYEIAGVSDSKKFGDLKQAMSSLNFSEKEQKQIFRIVAGLLHLGNITFKKKDADSVLIEEAAKASLYMASDMFVVDRQRLEQRLISRNIKVGVQVITKDLNFEDAQHNRNAMAKAIYHGLFHWIVAKINTQLYEKSGTKDVQWIGILDVFGFECSDFNNSFEQFCINFANERLQQFFNIHVIQSEQAEYLREGLPWTPVEVQDNQDTIDLVEAKPSGIIAVLDSACVMPKGSDEIFINNLFTVHRKHPKIKEARTRVYKKNPQAQKGAQKEKFCGFTIYHYAGDVTYNAQGFLDKNTDSTSPDTISLFSASEDGITKELLDPPSKDKKQAVKKTFSSLGASFQTQLSALMSTLQSTTPHFVRCVNPNQFKQPQSFDPEYVRPQLRCGGLIEALRILKLGYPSRVSYSHIYERYGHLLRAATKTELNQKDFAEVVFVAFGMNKKDYQLGLTKVFFKPGKQEFLEQVLGQANEISPDMIKKIHSLMVRKRISRARSAVLQLVRFQMWINKARSLARLSEVCGIGVAVAKAIVRPIKRVHKARAITVLQTGIRAVTGVKEREQQKAAVFALQKFIIERSRHHHLHTAIAARIQTTRAARSDAAGVVQKFAIACIRRKQLITAIDKRVAATRARKEHQAALDRAKREAEEKERLKKLEEERTAAEKAAAERKKKEEEEKKKREEDERKRQEEEEKRKREERARAEAEAKARGDKEEAERLKRAQEEADRIAKAEAAKKAAEEKAKAEAEDKLRRAEAARKKAEEWAAQQALREKEKQDEEQKKIQEVVERQEKATEERLKQRQEEEEQNKENPIYTPDMPKKFRPPPPKGPIPETVLAAHRARQEAIARARARSATGPQQETIVEPVEKRFELAPEPVREETPEEVDAQLRQALLNGNKFLKYGKKGTPHIRYVCVNVIGNLHWSESPMDPRKLIPSEGFIRLKDIKMVVKGKESVVFQRKISKNAPDMLCFSVVTNDRTLDLQAVNTKDRDLWVRALDSAVKDAKAGMTNFITGKKEDEVSTASSTATSTATSTNTQSATNGSATPTSPTNATASPPKVIEGKDGAPTVEIDENLAAETSITLNNDPTGIRTFLEYGEKLIKFDRSGKPSKRWVNCTEEKLYWGEVPRPSTSLDSSSLSLIDVINVAPGKTTDIFKSSKYSSSAPAEHCFSLVLKTRTLDLQANSEELRNQWVDALTKMVDFAKKKAHQQWLVAKREESIANRRSITGRQATPEAIQYATTGRIRSQTSANPGAGLTPLTGLSGPAGNLAQLASPGSGSAGGAATVAVNRTRSATTGFTMPVNKSPARPDLLSAFKDLKVEEAPLTEVPETEEEDTKEETTTTEAEEDGPSLPAVIKVMAKRNSVQMTADHMRLNMARQQALQQHKQRLAAEEAAKTKK